MSDNNVSLDTKEELGFTVKKAKQDILAWKAHLLRNINQDEARLDIIEALNETSIWLVEDWAMKFIPRKYRESRRDWFGKRGLSWHITVATRRASDPKQLEMMTFTHIFQSDSQDSYGVLAIMSDVVGKLKKTMPHLKTIFYRQDNAGCYRSGPTIVGVSLVSKLHGVTIKRMDFSDPQGGKGACDRKAANIKTHMKVHLNQGNDIETAHQMLNAMRSSVGVHGLSVTLCESLETPDNLIQVKLEGVSSFSNVEYNKNYLRVWKAYGIGPGKKITLGSVNIAKDARIPSLITNEDEVLTDKFSNKRSTTKGSTSNPTCANTGTATSVEAEECSDNTVQLFACPEEGCTKTYQRFSALQHHLDSEKHERALERETLLDKAIHGYAIRLDEQFTRVQIQQSSAEGTSSNQTTLPMGWALKSSTTTRGRFTDNQKQYLMSKFSIGESTGNKANAVSVAKSMITARDSNGQRLFSSDEFLTSQQISSFFSRMAAKRTLQIDLGVNDEQSTEYEQRFEELRNKVIAEVVPKHPICYDNNNLCELVKKSKLYIFSISMLRNICEQFDIPTAQITAKRKAPYINKLIEFVQNCSCHE